MAVVINCFSGDRMKETAKRYSFQLSRKTNAAVAAKLGVINGSKIRVIPPTRVVPSNHAASSSSIGSASKVVRRFQMAKGKFNRSLARINGTNVSYTLRKPATLNKVIVIN